MATEANYQTSKLKINIAQPLSCYVHRSNKLLLTWIVRMTAEFYRKCSYKKILKIYKNRWWLLLDGIIFSVFFKKKCQKNHIDVLRTCISYKQNVRFFCTEQVYPFNYCLNLEHWIVLSCVCNTVQCKGFKSIN